MNTLLDRFANGAAGFDPATYGMGPAQKFFSQTALAPSAPTVSVPSQPSPQPANALAFNRETSRDSASNPGLSAPQSPSSSALGFAPSQAAPSATTGIAHSGVPSSPSLSAPSFGTIGSTLGLATGVPGLGLVGGLVDFGLDMQTKDTLSDEFNDQLSPTQAFASAMLGPIGGLVGMQSYRDQASSKFAKDAKTANTGDKNAFGGNISGRDSRQARDQGRGGAAPKGHDPAMGGRDFSGTDPVGGTAGHASAPGDMGDGNRGSGFGGGFGGGGPDSEAGNRS